MASNRLGRINDELQRSVSEAIRTLKDPRVQNCMISVTAVHATPDLRYAKISVSVYEQDKVKDAIKGLRSASGFLRRAVGADLQLRYTPELVFEEDDSIAYGAHMSALIDALNKPKENSDENNS